MIVFRTDTKDKSILKNRGKLNLRGLTVLPHEITDIYGVICGGAYGDPNQWGAFVYGKRPDGKTVRCKVSYFQKDLSEGIDFVCVFVWSSYKVGKSPIDNAVCASVFHLDDWHKSGTMNKPDQKEYLGDILRKRRIAAYQSIKP